MMCLECIYPVGTSKAWLPKKLCNSHLDQFYDGGWDLEGYSEHVFGALFCAQDAAEVGVYQLIKVLVNHRVGSALRFCSMHSRSALRARLSATLTAAGVHERRCAISCGLCSSR